MMELHVLDQTAFADQRLHLLNTNHVLLFDSGMDEILEERSLAFSSAKLIWRFNTSVPQSDSMTAQEIFQLALIVHATVAHNCFWGSIRADPPM